LWPKIFSALFSQCSVGHLGNNSVGNETSALHSPWADLSGEMSLREARDLYLEVNGFSADSYTAPTFSFAMLGRTWTLPNSKARKRAIPLHDLHHVITGYNTDLRGEAEIGAWEIGAGCTNLFLYWINGNAVLFGGPLAPLRVWRAFRRGLKCRSLYKLGLDYEQLMEMSLEQAQRRTGP